MKKLTVKHYLNKKLKPIDDNKFAIYVRVIYNRNNTNFPSEISRLTHLNDIQFSNDKDVLRDKEYEIELINSIVDFGVTHHKDDFTISNINSLIRYWKDSISDLFFDFALGEKDIRPKIVDYFSSLTTFDISAIDDLISRGDLNISTLLLLANNNVFDKKIHNYILYVDMLSKFEVEKFGQDQWRYGADNTFNFYEWENRNLREKFKSFALKTSKLDKKDIDIITNEFDDYIIEYLNRIIKMKGLLAPRVR